MTIEDLNAYDRAAFVRALGWIFEESPWVAERAWDRRPFRSVDDLHAAMTTVVETAAQPEQLALLQAHPDLGTRARVSDVSSAEQQGAGLDHSTWRSLHASRSSTRTTARGSDFPFCLQ
jgi:2-oxo-4-hydroxy-4-carboxy-5-ureidoimidazoline decarboxylase